MPENEPFIFDSLLGVGRTVLVGTLAYVLLIVFLRISGKRTLSKMNAFDLVVTVAIGSTLATILLSKDVALAEGAAAFATLIGAQYLITFISVRSEWFRKLVKSEPTLLFHEGRFLTEKLRRERVTQAEVRAAVRAQGFTHMQSVGAVVLETDGSFTVLPAQDKRSKPTTLANVEYEPIRKDQHGDT